MLRRFSTGWMDGMWTSPAGHIEAGESARACAVRETYEEVGVTVEPGNLKHAITVHRRNPDSGAIYFDNYFTARRWQGEPYVAEPDKAVAAGWLELNNLPNNVVPTVLSALRRYLSGEHYS